jgi:DNA-binding NtrC family response regulator
MQAKLLRVLQDGQFQRLGATRDIRGDFRLLCATHTDIPKAIDEQRFRSDLYYRINTVQIVLPPLRERHGDVPLLASHFLRTFAAEMNKDVHGIDACALDQLLAHSWPGNVRELEHVIQRAVALAAGDTIRSVEFAPAAGGSASGGRETWDSSIVSIPIGTSADEATKRFVRATVEQCAGNKFQAARILGIPSRTMYRNFGSVSR